MTAPMIVGIVIGSWMVGSLLFALALGPILERLRKAGEFVPPQPCLMCELERIEKQVRP